MTEQGFALGEPTADFEDIGNDAPSKKPNGLSVFEPGAVLPPVPAAVVIA